jgi:CDP-diacylglycerol--glycerol-3-phosphate 3-phosphatidyltransferase
LDFEEIGGFSMEIWRKMNLANKVTMVRFLLVPVFILLVSLFHGWGADLLAGLVFVVASCTDFIDGHIARSRNLVTTFGKFMDPLVDKILVTAALVALVAMGRTPAWVVILILAREFAITGLRTVAVSEGVVIAASPLGKLKTTCQMVAIAFLLLYTLPFLPNTLIYVCGQVLMYAALVLTLLSGWDYLKGCRELLSDM